MERVNLHGTAVVLDGRGVLILGPSGAGKSSLALALLDRFHAGFRFASLVADDRVWLTAGSGRLVAEAPEAIAGLVEIRGFGPAAFPHESRAVIDLAVALVEPGVAPRHREDAEETILGLAIPRLDLARGDIAGAARAVDAWITGRFAP